MNRWNERLRELLFLPEQASTVAFEVDSLHYFVIITTMLGATAVALMAAIFILRYRARGERGPTAHWEMSNPLKVGLLGLLVVLFVWWWWRGIQQYMRMRVVPQDATEIYVLGKQWMFKFGYPEGVASIHTLYVPAGRPIKLIMTSRDVIHSFYVPEFRVKQDLVPGLYTTAWFEAPAPGTYDILCAEFCGTDHSVMRGKVVVLPPAQYAGWLEAGEAGEAGLDAGARADQPEVSLGLVDVGRAVATDHGCLRCHTTDGTPHIGPSFANLYGARIQLADGTTVIADEAYLTESMMDPLARLHRGYQAVMPSYKGRLQPAQVAALLELIKALREGQQDEYPRARAEGLPVYPQPTPTTRLEAPSRTRSDRDG